MNRLRSKKDYVYIYNVKHDYLIEDWDMGNGYEITLSLNKSICQLSIFDTEGNRLNYEIAKRLNIDTSYEKIVPCTDSDPEGRELYLSSGICSESIKYTKPKDYRILLQKIEKILNEIKALGKP